ncbi:LOW QUALITY PROTEIN: serine-type D-Ala-D-Ala carboxypeptidase, partial [Micromonospora sp. M42]
GPGDPSWRWPPPCWCRCRSRPRWRASARPYAGCRPRCPARTCRPRRPGRRSRRPRPIRPRGPSAARRWTPPGWSSRPRRPRRRRSPPPPGWSPTWTAARCSAAAGRTSNAVPASVQKLLLAATMLPRLDPNREVTVTAGDLAVEPGSSAVGLVEGGRYRIETIWLGLLLRSGNEAANALARLGGGPDGLAGGVRAMNEEAHRLGARQTHAVTPSGLDGPGQFTSAYDLALIARACFANPAFRRYAATRTAQIPAQPALRKKAFAISNDNMLLDQYPGAIGGKTGFTDLARHTYVGAAERGGRRLVVTLLGAEVTSQRGWQQGAALLDWGFAQPRDASVGRLVEPGELDRTAPPAGGGASALAGHADLRAARRAPAPPPAPV